jgi:hypothetical protein
LEVPYLLLKELVGVSQTVFRVHTQLTAVRQSTGFAEEVSAV